MVRFSTILSIYLITLLTIIYKESYGFVYKTISSGNFEDKKIWNAKLPSVFDTNDTLLINHTIQLNTNQNITGTWIINSGILLNGTSKTIDIDSKGNLILKGILKIKSINNDGTIIVINGSAEIYGNLQNNSKSSFINGSNGNFKISNNIINKAGGKISGTLNFCSVDGNTSPFLPNSKNIDWTTVTICGLTNKNENESETMQGPLSISANLEAEGVRIYWSTNDISGDEWFDLEKSYDGIQFEKIITIYSTHHIYYNYLDENEKHNLVYYRVKKFDSDGNNNASQLISITQNNTENIEIFPNPCNKNDLIYIKSQSASNTFDIDIMNSQGDIIYSSHSEKEEIEIPQFTFLPGVYYLYLTSETEQKISKLIIE